MQKLSRPAVFVFVALFAPVAMASEKVDIQTEVIFASDDGDQVDPPGLSKMKDEFGRSGIHYSSWKRLSDRRVSLEKDKPQDVALPDGRKATLHLQKIQDGSAFVKVTIPQDDKRKLVDTVYQVGRQGSVFIGPVTFQKGVLILVLSPPDQKRGEVAPPAPQGIDRRKLIVLEGRPPRKAHMELAAPVAE